MTFATVMYYDKEDNTKEQLALNAELTELVHDWLEARGLAAERSIDDPETGTLTRHWADRQTAEEFVELTDSVRERFSVPDWPMEIVEL